MSAPIEQLFPELANYTDSDYARIGTDRPTLMIAMTPRTGSTHLCSALSSVLPVGKPIELLNGRDTLVWEKKRRSIDTFEELLTQYFSESEKHIIFKTSWGDFEYFQDVIYTIFPNMQVIYLNRLDVEAQAVSLFRAVVTGNWHDSPTISNNSSMTDEEILLKFDLKRICSIIDSLEIEKASWEQFFFKNNINPARIYYEFFENSLEKAIFFISHHLGYKDINTNSLKSDFNKISDKINDQWKFKVKNYRNGNFFIRNRSKIMSAS